LFAESQAISVPINKSEQIQKLVVVRGKYFTGWSKFSGFAASFARLCARFGKSLREF
jgi:hypothetical protein